MNGSNLILVDRIAALYKQAFARLKKQISLIGKSGWSRLYVGQSVTATSLLTRNEFMMIAIIASTCNILNYGNHGNSGLQ